MRPKLTLADLKFVPKTPVFAGAPVATAVDPRPDPMEPQVTERPALSCKQLPQAVWCPLGPNWLRVVLDERAMEKRIYRIELYDKDRKERRAVFRRQTEAMRR